MERRLKQIGLWVLGFVIAFFAIKGIKNFFNEEVAITNIQAKIEEDLVKLNNPIVKEGQSKSEAVVNNAISKAQESLANASTDINKLDKAINMFRGFYLVNAKARPKFCLKYNVNIDSFVKEFEKEHVKEYAFMKTYESSNQPIDGKTYTMLYDLLDKQVSTEMSNTAKEYNITIEAYCKTFEANPKDYVEEIKISKRMPEIYNLMNK